ncbi:snoRNA-binding rRNA-processing protein [Yamadazyma tenuis]|uniref:snoRNA-binding rRNA-processing protein n=1 Tax=Candida tenuis TaxID=2315449 RepID=UPI0027A8C58E|nr:snoRNA-binding rRNA-processing protein [Yamadazyma tenuis]
MGKITVNDTKEKPRHNPLHRDITSLNGGLKTHQKSRKTSNTMGENGEEFLDASTSRRILKLAKEQQEEIEEEDEGNKTSKASFLEAFRAQEQEEEQFEESDEEAEYSDFEEEFYDEEEIEVNEQDAEMFEKYFSTGNGIGGSINLADKIMAKIQEKEIMRSTGGRPVDGVKLPPKVIAAYEKIGQILANYRHGKLPKLFKVLPSLKNWQDVLYVTNPESWTPHAVYEATKLFVSNLQANEAQKFIESILLERFRVGIEDSEDHSVNYHIYRAIKKSLYKPGAFFKGFLFPLVDGHCSVREATIAASVLAKVSVPVLHSSVALSQLAQRDFSPASTVFIRVLVEKKYALPYQTLDDLVFYFMRFRKVEQQQVDMMIDTEANEGTKSNLPSLPVVWHKAFLAFAQRYKNDITDDQRDFLLETVRQRFHQGIGPEIRRELLAGTPRAPQQVEEAVMMNAF